MATQPLAIRLKDADETEIKDRIVVCEQIPALDVLRLVLERSANQVIQEKNPEWESELKASAIMLAAPRSFMDMPLCTILAPEILSKEMERKLCQVEKSFSRSDEKETTLTSMRALLQSVNCTPSFVADVSLVADEMYTNAIYNAGFQDTAGVSRSQKVQISKSCRMFLGLNSERIVLGCEDPFGTLDIKRLLEQIKKCEENGAQQAITWGVGGAGLGSYIIFQNAMSMFYGVEEGKRTIVAAVFPLGKGGRARAKMAKSVHYIVTKGPQTEE